jgi:hypothetical protein
MCKPILYPVNRIKIYVPRARKENSPIDSFQDVVFTVTGAVVIFIETYGSVRLNRIDHSIF